MDSINTETQNENTEIIDSDTSINITNTDETQNKKFSSSEASIERLSKLSDEVINEFKLWSRNFDSIFNIFIAEIRTRCIEYKTTRDHHDTERMWMQIVFSMCMSFRYDHNLRPKQYTETEFNNINKYMKTASVIDLLQIFIDITQQNCHNVKQIINSHDNNSLQTDSDELKYNESMLQQLYHDFVDLYRRCTGTWKPLKTYGPNTNEPNTKISYDKNRRERKFYKTNPFYDNTEDKYPVQNNNGRPRPKHFESATINQQSQINKQRFQGLQNNQFPKQENSRQTINNRDNKFLRQKPQDQQTYNNGSRNNRTQLLQRSPERHDSGNRFVRSHPLQQSPEERQINNSGNTMVRTQTLQRSPERLVPERQVNERQANERQVPERQVPGRQVPGRQVNERQVPERQANERQVPERQVNERHPRPREIPRPQKTQIYDITPKIHKIM